jgi:hypothetical protein
MDGSADGTPHDTIEEEKQSWVTIFVISYTNSMIFNKREHDRIRENVSKGFDVQIWKIILYCSYEKIITKCLHFILFILLYFV